MAGMLNQLEIIVSAEDTDDLGHVNNARFLDYFERGRMRWYNSVGLFRRPSTGGRLGTVVVSIKVNYRAECFQGDRLNVITSPRSRGNRSYILHQEIRRESVELVSDAEVTSVVMNLDERVTVDMPPELARQFNRDPFKEKS